MRVRIKQSRPQNLNDAIRLAVELETFNRAERRVMEGRSYLRTTAADSTAGKVSDIIKSWCIIKFAWSEVFILKLVDISL
jgi:hypothetical protein